MSADPEDPAPQDDAPEGERTVYMPGPSAPPSPTPEPAGTTIPPAPPEDQVQAAPAEPTGWSAPPTPPAAAQARPEQVEVGSVLNHIYKVTRFIARGGMGEVYEGESLQTDERVAIKVMLPSLAADPNVQAMFRKEARTLTRLSHPAVVQYRVLAQEPTLGVLYIVTEYIDGAPLSDLLPTLKPTTAQLKGLIRRLAEGLRAAHDLGAVHRDMSPDNVLLADGKLENAKIIDFGIAKDLDPSKATIVGDGFAGKLGFVAPEQFGDFGREVGAWTDVYSLGLVILTVAKGSAVDMGATLVDAIDKRRAGPDLSVAPEALRPVLAKMLAANPKDRFRSMNEVLEALDAPTAATAPPAADRTVFQPQVPLPPPPGTSKPAATKSGPPRALLFGGAALVLVAVVGGVAAMMLSKPKPAATSASSSAPAVAAAPGAERVRQAVETALPSIGCTWLDLDQAADGPGGVALRLAGVAAQPAAAQGAVASAASATGVKVGEINLEDVAPVDPPVCAPLDAFRAIRADTSQAGRRLSTAQRKFEMLKQTNGKLAGRAVITMALRDPSLDFALVGLEPSGKIDMIIPNRATFAGIPKTGQPIADLGGDTYRLQIDTDHQGWSGLLLLTGKGPFDPALVAAKPETRGDDWPAKFEAAARAGGWKAEMVWYKTTPAAG